MSTICLPGPGWDWEQGRWRRAETGNPSAAQERNAPSPPVYARTYLSNIFAHTKYREWGKPPASSFILGRGTCEMSGPRRPALLLGSGRGRGTGKGRGGKGREGKGTVALCCPALGLGPEEDALFHLPLQHSHQRPADQAVFELRKMYERW